MALSLVPPSDPPELPTLDELLQEDEGAYLGIQVDASHWAIVGELEADDYVHEIEGSVAVFGSSGELLGRLGSYLVKLIDVDSALADNESVFDIFDQSSSTIDYFGLYEKGGWNFKESVLRALGCDGESVPCSLLVIDRLELLPNYRGMGASGHGVHDRALSNGRRHGGDQAVPAAVRR